MSDPDPAPLEPSQQEGTNLEDVFWKHGADLDLSSSLNEAEEDIRCENLADALVQKVTPTAGDLAILDDAIMLYENVLRLRPIGHPRRVEALSSLAGTHVLYCQRQRDALRLQRGISLHQAALALRSVNDSGRIASLEALATALALRYEQEGHGPSLAEALSHIRGALELTPCGHSERPQILSRLAVIHIRFFDHAREDQALVEAASAMREALTLSPPDHPLRDRFLSNMAVITGTLAETHSDLESLTECITTLHEALALQPLGHPRRPLTQGNLSNALRLRFIHHGHKQDLDESIALARVVAEAIPPGHQLYNPFMLAHRLELNFDYGGGPGNLEEAISILRVALETDGLNHFYRNLCTRELGVVLRKSFEQSSDLSRLDDSILWLREALSLCSEDTRHLGVVLLELATSLRLQAHQRQDPSAVAEAIDLLRQSLVEYAQDHTERPLALCESALCLLDSDMPSFDFFAALEYISEAVTDQITPARERLRAGIRSLHAVEAASGVALVDGDLSQAESVLNLYACTMQLLPRVANFGLDHADRLAALAGSEELGRAAASWATLLNRRRQAVELLEEGRGVFWSQALRLRASGLDGITDTDRQALERIFRVLEQGSHDVNRDHSAAQRERGLEKRRALSANADAIISRIRTQPGLQRFLMPPSFLDITRTLADGFVVLLFSSGSRHHALIVSGATKAVQYIALALPEGKLSLPAMKNSIPRDASKEPTDQPDGRGMRLVSTKGRSALVDTLQGLWTCVVKPIVSAMGLKKATGRERPRVWWVPTGNFSFLPLHAAGVYSGNAQEYSAQYLVSSYVPTISALLKAQQDWKPIPTPALRSLLYGVSAGMRGLGQLEHASNEVAVVRKRMLEASVLVVNDASCSPTVSAVRAGLETADAHVLHLACHGLQHADPLSSCFVLEDGMLTVGDLMKLNLPHATLAFLSACQTAKGDSAQPDQAVHLAASMLFCGFRSVIGTMWSMSDVDGPAMAEWVYDDLLKRKHLDLNDIPYALDAAVERLRLTGAPPSRWALFLHMGG